MARTAAALLVALPLVASAQGAAPPPQYAPPPPQYAPPPPQYAPPPPQYAPPQYAPPQYGPPAQYPPQALNAHRHTGFFLRPDLGLGYVSTKASQGGDTLTISGAGGAFGIALGGAVSENVILGFHAWDIVASSPDVEVSSGGTTYSGSTSADTSSALVGYGLLVNWYFMPANVYVALTPSLTRLVSDSDSGSGASEWGLGLRGAVGKEWWVSNHWGLGVAGALAFSSNKDAYPGAPTMNTFGFSVSLSATYN